jgi:ABC-type dipeptide/oligopeptide/nickel transport system permease subunit
MADGPTRDHPEADPGTPEPDAVQESQTYSKLVWRQFKKNRPALFSLAAIGVLALTAVFADFLAGNKPYYMKYRGKTYFPAFRQYAVYLGLADWPAPLRRKRNFKRLRSEYAIFPPVPYGPSDVNLGEKYQPPGTTHFLGTDRLGRDVLSGLIHGSRYALTIGLVSVTISMIIGVSLGALAGYFGGWPDLILSRLFELWAAIPALFLIITVAAFFSAQPLLRDDHSRLHGLGRHRPAHAVAIPAGEKLRLCFRGQEPGIFQRPDHVHPHFAQRNCASAHPGGLRGGGRHSGGIRPQFSRHRRTRGGHHLGRDPCRRPKQFRGLVAGHRTRFRHLYHRNPLQPAW